jgi:hypothetical protein
MISFIERIGINCFKPKEENNNKISTIRSVVKQKAISIIQSKIIKDLKPENISECRILIEEFVNKTIKNLKCTNNVIIGGLIYFEKYDQLEKKETININNISKIFTICMIESLKMNTDNYEDNFDYFQKTKYVFVNLKELNRLEMNFLKSIDYKLYISSNQFSENYNKIFSS